MELDRQQARRYARHILLPDIGGHGQRRLLDATVAVPLDDDPAAAGVAVAYLCAAGVGQVRLVGGNRSVDERLVSASMWLRKADIGVPYHQALTRAAAALNPDCTVTAGAPGDEPRCALPAADSTLAEALERGGRCAAVVIAAIARAAEQASP